jgi:membrane-associated protease RseP (regulator of RpoE activity)
MTELRDYEPLHPKGFDWRRLARAIWAPIAFVGGLAIKFGFVFVKFAALFVSVGAYALIGGWQWGVGIVVLIFVHEMGHFLEAKRQGVRVSWPTFIPFFGAYVTIHRAGLTPWRSASIALAGPFVGGLGAAVCWAIGHAYDSHLFTTLGYTGFFLNLFNLIPVGFLDGGAIARAATEAWRMPVIQFENGVPMRALAPDRGRAVAIAALYFALVGLLVYGMVKTHVPQHRL